MSNDEAIWQRLVKSNEEYMAASRDFLKGVANRIDLIRRGLHGRVIEVMTALGIVPYIEVSERLQLFEELVQLSVAQRYATRVRKLIASLPRDWVLANIERAAEPILLHGDNIDYRMVLELYLMLDGNLAFKLAERAAAHPDEDTREAGEEYFKRLILLTGRKDLGEKG